MQVIYNNTQYRVVGQTALGRLFLADKSGILLDSNGHQMPIDPQHITKTRIRAAAVLAVKPEPLPEDFVSSLLDYRPEPTPTPTPKQTISLWRLRRNANLTQRRLAERLGCSVEDIGRLERGKTRPRCVDLVLRIIAELS